MSLIDDLKPEEYYCTKCGAIIDMVPMADMDDDAIMFTCGNCGHKLVYEKEKVKTDNSGFILVGSGEDGSKFYKEDGKLFMKDGIKDDLGNKKNIY